MSKSLDIIVVDDNPEILTMFEEILAMEGHKVRVFETAILAVNDFHRQSCDLVISDLGMPDISGWQLARMVRDLDATVPIVFITAVGEYVNPEKVTALGVCAVLRKPFRLAQIKDILEGLT